MKDDLTALDPCPSCGAERLAWMTGRLFCQACGVDAHVAQQSAKRDESSGIKKYTVTGTLVVSVEVEAESEDEAQEGFEEEVGQPVIGGESMPWSELEVEDDDDFE